jgi:hypothetical protein
MYSESILVRISDLLGLRCFSFIFELFLHFAHVQGVAAAAFPVVPTNDVVNGDARPLRNRGVNLVAGCALLLDELVCKEPKS